MLPDYLTNLSCSPPPPLPSSGFCYYGAFARLDNHSESVTFDRGNGDARNFTGGDNVAVRVVPPLPGTHQRIREGAEEAVRIVGERGEVEFEGMIVGGGVSGTVVRTLLKDSVDKIAYLAGVGCRFRIDRLTSRVVYNRQVTAFTAMANHPALNRGSEEGGGLEKVGINAEGEGEEIDEQDVRDTGMGSKKQSSTCNRCVARAITSGDGGEVVRNATEEFRVKGAGGVEVEIGGEGMNDSQVRDKNEEGMTGGAE